MNWPAILTGAGALLAGLGSILTANSARKKACDEATEKCHEDLIAVRAESEKFSEELHKMRLAHPGES